MPRLPISLALLCVGCSVTLDLDRPPERVTRLHDAAGDVISVDSGQLLDARVEPDAVAPDARVDPVADLGADTGPDAGPDAAPDRGPDVGADAEAPAELVEVRPVGEQREGQSIGADVGASSQSDCRDGRLAVGLDARVLPSGVLVAARAACAPVEIRPGFGRWVVARGPITFGPWIGLDEGGAVEALRCGEDAVLFGVTGHTGLRILTLGGLCRRLGAEPIAGGGWGLALLELQQTELVGAGGQGDSARAQCLDNRMAVGLDGHALFDPLGRTDVLRKIGVRCDAVQVSGP